MATIVSASYCELHSKCGAINSYVSYNNFFFSSRRATTTTTGAATTRQPETHTDTRIDRDTTTDTARDKDADRDKTIIVTLDPQNSSVQVSPSQSKTV